jgi:Spx/MgsR family transcriptional regulator
MPAKIMFFQKPTCTTCRKAKALLLKLKIPFDSRDLDKQRLSESELDELIGKRNHQDFLNSRNELYRQRNMSELPPSRAEAIKLMAQHPNLIRRPMLVRGTQILHGFDETAYRNLAR